MGGSALQWIVELNEDVTPGSFYEVNLSMRKIGAPDVTIGWELLVVDPNDPEVSTYTAEEC